MGHYRVAIDTGGRGRRMPDRARQPDEPTSTEVPDAHTGASDMNDNAIVPEPEKAGLRFSAGVDE